MRRSFYYYANENVRSYLLQLAEERLPIDPTSSWHFLLEWGRLEGAV